ncbi:MAG: outer membrane protein transport protein [gamma proteobacterium symbiont of Bathyaustriella thionipta]|nr:outer membrane protein transport protein [gamma proteobacterium symbiont of Bathyaustriella thionipta]
MNTDYGSGGKALVPVDTNFDGVPDNTAAQKGVFGAGDTLIDYSQAFLNLTYAHKLGDSVSVGVSGILAAQRIKIKGLGTFAPFTESFVKSGFTKLPSDLTNNGYDYSYGAGIKVGIDAALMDGLRIGASYQSKIYMSEFDDYADMLANDGDMDIPATATIGLAWQPSTAHAFTLDYQYIWYSDVDAIGNSMGNLFKCPSAGGTDQSSCLGGTNGPGFGWDNMGVVKAGYQFTYNEKWQVRAGYSIGDQPVNKEDVVFNIMAPATIEQHFTFGLTHKFDNKNELNFAFMYTPSNSVKGSNPLAGPSSPLNPAAQDVKITMHQIEAELSYSWVWD